MDNWPFKCHFKNVHHKIYAIARENIQIFIETIFMNMINVGNFLLSR